MSCLNQPSRPDAGNTLLLLGGIRRQPAREVGDALDALRHAVGDQIGAAVVAAQLFRVGREAARQVRHADAVGHAVGDQVGRHGAHGVLGRRAGAQQARRHGLRLQDRRRRDDGGRGDLLDDRLGDGGLARPDRGREDLLEALCAGDELDALEVLLFGTVWLGGKVKRRFGF